MSSSKNAKGFLIGFFAGGAIGAIVALLTTPKSGKEFRGEIKQKSGEYMDEIDKYYTEKKHQVNEMIGEVKRKFTMIMDDVRSKPEEILKGAEQVFNDAKVKAKDVLQSGKEKIDMETERLNSAVKAGIDTYKKEVKNQ